MTKSDRKEVKLEIDLPQNGYRKILYFNRFHIQHEEGYTLAHFGLVAKSGVLLDSYACAFSYETIENNKKALLDYLGKIGQSTTKRPLWPVTPSGICVDVADMIHIASQGATGEIVLCLVSTNAAMQMVKNPTNEKIQVTALALLRSTIELQKQFIQAIYED